MTDTPVTYISVGNSDDALGQAEWAEYHASVDRMLRQSGWTIHGAWMSLPNSYWQNACWAVEVPAEHPAPPDGHEPLVGTPTADLHRGLAVLAQRFRQNSVAVVTGVPIFVGPADAQQPPREAPLPVDSPGA